ncbi:TPA: DUF4942 domain-containing protein [Aeromonas salmonicida]|uniref:Restriction endonuclease subunit M n=2 Tax=Aeromonas salmonicida TaxID=645 RepID=A0A8F3ERK5_AERSS|nr:class I SAM-dependent methyltransferase [Aeromonas salmonicida]MBM9522637.1 DUF4942 domain-containing protein [Aeromonas salmonicida subsp. salmonicida]QWY91803.1 restriction endonuclease subunit M [Aeromonas salmonicida subsp. salmonicida]HDN9804014.1 DUF4942 domain-containing protein [Aeromonas salmonicida]HDO0961098.1 DUF4942 domain-containing protein [Aeromonas salmonicida]HDO0974827.1 DUF4942 domain-containing protein [Aeromonas salmonicida]
MNITASSDSILMTGSGFFAPVSADMVDGIVGRYRDMRANIEAVAQFIHGGDNAAAIGYFLSGNHGNHDRYIKSVAEVFKLEGAIAQLNANYWQQAMQLTDVYDYMPAKRRDEWNEQIREKKTPDFEEETVRSTLMDLLSSRHKFFGERVDGIFQNLSGEHVTNQPQGFSKRMIIYVSHRKEYITDLRQVVAKFMGREDEPNWQNTDQMLAAANRNSGQWVGIDGGAMRIRTYKKGTAHFEIHPDMAWKLNCVLASMYPMAIPAEFRQKPKKKLKDFVMMERPLPFAVVRAIAEMQRPRTTPWRSSFDHSMRDPVTTNRNSLEFRYCDDKAVRAEVANALAAIGAVHMTKGGYEWFEFGYDMREAIDAVISSGCIPDHKSHQFYPTPEKLAKLAVEMADIDPAKHNCLEPSAGQGGLADHINTQWLTCVEVSKLHCEILKAKGYTVVQGDFMGLEGGPKYDRVVMNPPFSEGRWRAHTEHAASMVKPRGRLVAILPSGAKNSFTIPGFDCRWSKVFDNEFQGASVSVVILCADAQVEAA